MHKKVNSTVCGQGQWESKECPQLIENSLSVSFPSANAFPPPAKDVHQ